MDSKTTVQVAGRQMLIELCARERGMARRIAKALSVSPATISRWTKRTDPDVEYRHALQRLFEIPANAWLGPEKYRIAFGGDEGGGSGAVEHGDGGASCAL